MQPSDESCVLSTMKFVQCEALRLGQTPKLTFDLPLFIKSCKLKLQNDDLANIVLFLGQFHQQKSFIGTIATIMSGSGLDGVLATVYGEKAGNIRPKSSFCVDFLLHFEPLINFFLPS